MGPVGPDHQATAGGYLNAGTRVRLRRGGGVSAKPNGRDLGHDGQCNLAGIAAAEIESDGTEQPVQSRLVDSGIAKPLSPVPLGFSRSDRADVRGRRGEREADRRFIEFWVV